MTDIIQLPAPPAKAGVRRMTRHSLKVDMTPMTDLGFLLIAFFIVTAELSKPTAMNLFMPKDEGPPTDLAESKAMTVLLSGQNKLFYYTGSWEEALIGNKITPVHYSGKGSIREIIVSKQLQLTAEYGKTGQEELMLLIKADKSASWKNVIDVLDEAVITQLKKYALVRLSEAELSWLEQKDR